MSYINSLMNIKNKPLTLEESTVYRPVEKSDFVTMLEFNEEVFIADLTCTRDFYKSLLESGQYVLNEGVFSAIGTFLEKIILTISYAFNYAFAGKSDNKQNKNYSQASSIINKNIERMKRAQKDFSIVYKDLNSGANESRKVIKYNRPSGYDIPNMSNIISGTLNNQLNEIINESDKICDGIKNKSFSSEAAKKIADDLVAKEKQLTEAINNYDVQSGFSIEEETLQIGDYLNNAYINIDRYTKFSNAVGKASMDNLPEFKAIVDNLKNFKNNLTTDDSDNDEIAPSVRLLSTTHSELAMAITKKINSYCTSMYSSLVKETKQLISLLNIVLNKDDEEDEAVDEMAHFENSIDAEMAEYRWSLMEAYKEGIVKEAVIKANPDSDVVYEMQVLNEAIATKARDAINKLIAKLKEIFRRFMEKIRANFTSTRNYAQKYQKIILNNKVPDPAYRANDFLRGMDAVLNFEIDPFNYTQLQDKLGSNYAFFDYLRKTQGNKYPPQYTISVQPAEGRDSETDISTWFKEYFGVLEESQYIETTAEAIEARMKDIYDFMFDIRKIDRALNKDLASIDKMKNEVIKQASASTGVQIRDEQPPAGQQQQTAESMYYSYIDNLSTFLEIEVAGNQAQQNTGNAAGQPTANNTNRTTYTNMTGRVADNTARFRNDQQDPKNQYGTAGAQLDDLNAKCDVYVSVVGSAIRAKLTAIEAFRKDYEFIFRRMVNHYIGGEAQTRQGRAQNTQDFINMQNRDTQNRNLGQ